MTVTAAPDLAALTLATVAALDLQHGDLIGGTAGEWLRVSSVYVDPNVKHLVAEVEVAPLTGTPRPRTWMIDAFAKVAILRATGGVR
jgi:hypothetical protein